MIFQTISVYILSDSHFIFSGDVNEPNLFRFNAITSQFVIWSCHSKPEKPAACNFEMKTHDSLRFALQQQSQAKREIIEPLKSQTDHVSSLQIL